MKLKALSNKNVKEEEKKRDNHGRKQYLIWKEIMIIKFIKIVSTYTVHVWIIPYLSLRSIIKWKFKISSLLLPTSMLSLKYFFQAQRIIFFLSIRKNGKVDGDTNWHSKSITFLFQAIVLCWWVVQGLSDTMWMSVIFCITYISFGVIQCDCVS